MTVLFVAAALAVTVLLLRQVLIAEQMPQQFVAWTRGFVDSREGLLLLVNLLMLVAGTFLAWSPTTLLVRTVPLTWPELVLVPAATVLVAIGPAFWTPPLPNTGRPRMAGGHL